MIGRNSVGFGIYVHLYTTKGKLRKRSSHTYYKHEAFLIDYLERKNIRKM